MAAVSGWDVLDLRRAPLRSLFDQAPSEDDIVHGVSSGFASDLSKILSSNAAGTVGPTNSGRPPQRRG